MNYSYSWLSEKITATKVAYGFGLCALSKIKKNERVIVFGGYVITPKQFDALSEKLQNLTFQLDNDLFFGLSKESELERTEYLNHSCEPNCGFNGEITVVAMRDIKKGEEITIDYAMCISAKRIVPMECLCGSNICRKNITANDWKIKDLKEKYKGYFVRFIEGKIQKSHSE